MTDKDTNEKDFNLNKFDATNDTSHDAPHSKNSDKPISPSQEIDSFYGSDIFADPTPQPTASTAAESQGPSPDNSGLDNSAPDGLSRNDTSLDNPDPFSNIWDDNHAEQPAYEQGKQAPSIPETSEDKDQINTEAEDSLSQQLDALADNSAGPEIIGPYTPDTDTAAPNTTAPDTTNSDSIANHTTVKHTTSNSEENNNSDIDNADMRSDNIEQPFMTAAAAPPADETKTSAVKTISIFAIIAMLVAAIAIWLNAGMKNDEHSSPTPQPTSAQPVLNTNIQIQRMDRRLSAIEQQADQQRETLGQQINTLEEQISSLSNLVTVQAQQPGKIKKQAAITKQTPVQPQTIQPITAPVAPQSSQPAAQQTTAAPADKNRYIGWVVNLVSLDSHSAAKRALAMFKSKGIAAEIRPGVVKGKTWFRVQISGFNSKQEAMTQKAYVAKHHGIKDTWVHKP